MKFFFQPSSLFCIIPTIAFSDEGGCECGCTEGRAVLITWAGFEIGFAFLCTPKPRLTAKDDDFHDDPNP